jgi:hypothetical protein
MSDIQSFQALISTITEAIGNRTLDEALQRDLNQQFPYEGEAAQAIRQTCVQGMAQGWMGQHEHRGLRYGRVIEPCKTLNGFSVDVVDMNDIVGPHHRHPGAHSPTVTQGRALILYLLPRGEIEFTRR